MAIRPPFDKWKFIRHIVNIAIGVSVLAIVTYFLLPIAIDDVIHYDVNDTSW